LYERWQFQRPPGFCAGLEGSARKWSCDLQHLFWHGLPELKSKKVLRVTFHEVTERAVQKALKSPIFSYWIIDIGAFWISC